MTINLQEHERQILLGALDTLGVCLAAHNHTWTEGERAIYENAMAILRVPVAPEFRTTDTDAIGEEWKDSR